jgi:hypothetical protein
MRLYASFRVCSAAVGHAQVRLRVCAYLVTATIFRRNRYVRDGPLTDHSSVLACLFLPSVTDGSFLRSNIGNISCVLGNTTLAIHR